MIEVEKFEFQTEARQLLDLMIHSVYSHKEIFLRELISNASDAIDKLRFEALTNEELSRFAGNPEIRISADKTARTLSVADNGIGMTRDEVIKYIGTIAKSGTREFSKMLTEAKDKAAVSADLIGQFGVGFYSAFMVADKVTLVTRRAGEEKAIRWESIGDGSYTLDEDSRFEPGTTVTLHLKPQEQEDEGEEQHQDYLDEWTIRTIVKKYSDFVAYPIRMKVERHHHDEETKKDEVSFEDEVLNSQKAIWTRPEKEVADSEYTEFYKHVSHDWNDPMRRIVMRAEGTSEFRALLFIPSKAPWDIFMRDTTHTGVQLFIKRVFIMHDCKELIPEYMRWLRGVVDSEDLSLNISREILQQNRQIQLIRRAIVKKVFDTLKAMRKEEEEKFRTFWKEFGRVFKEGLFQDQQNRDTLLEIAVFESTASGDGFTSLDEYVGRMKDGQDAIYYITGPSRAAVENSPHLEAFRDKGYEVLFFADPVDELWTQSTFKYKDKRMQSVGKGSADLGTEEERKKAEEERKTKEGEFKDLLDALKAKLDEYVKEVRLSSRLTSSPACLVGDAYDPSPLLEQLMRASGQDAPRTKRILELNAGHPILARLKAIFEADKDDPRIGEYAELLYGQSLLAEGGQPPDAAGFSKRVAELMTKALG